MYWKYEDLDFSEAYSLVGGGKNDLVYGHMSCAFREGSYEEEGFIISFDKDIKKYSVEFKEKKKGK